MVWLSPLDWEGLETLLPTKAVCFAYGNTRAWCAGSNRIWLPHGALPLPLKTSLSFSEEPEPIVTVKLLKMVLFGSFKITQVYCRWPAFLPWPLSILQQSRYLYNHYFLTVKVCLMTFIRIAHNQSNSYDIKSKHLKCVFLMMKSLQYPWWSIF